jgi:ABC-type transporter Mla subunit MlaD
MAVHDLTPQLRTRLSRLEKLVGWFVTIATLLLLVGLGYYVYSLAERKGWFLAKAPYFTYLRSGAGIRIGGPVRLMGFDAGKITKVVPEKPGAEYNVYVEFVVYEPNYGYVWDDSVVHVKSAGFLGERFLEISKGGTRRSTNLHATFKEDAGGKPVQIWDQQKAVYLDWQKGGKAYWLAAEEPPELSSQMDEVVQTIKTSLTNILALTNALTRTLTNAAEATGNLNELLANAKPLVTNLNTIASNLKEPRGSLGEWLFPTNMHFQITALLTNADATLVNVNSTVTNANTNLVPVFSNITVSLENLANITSNLNSQVQQNTNILSSVSKLVVDADDMVQGLKRHWLLRSAFKNKQDKQEPLRPRSSKGGGREP